MAQFIKRIETWSANLLWAVLGNALWSAIAGGGVLALTVSIIAYFTSHPEWLERGATALGTCVAIALFTAIISLVRSRWQESAAITNPSATPLGIPIPLPKMRTAEEWSDFKPDQILNRKFAHEDVMLDGKNYVNCEFLHVNLFYDGTAPAAMTNCQFDLDTIQHFHSHSPAMAQLVEIIRNLHMLKDNIQFGITPLPRDR